MQVVAASNSIVSALVIRTASTCMSLSNVANFTLQTSELGPCGGLCVTISNSNNLRFFDNFLHSEYQTTVQDAGDAMLITGSTAITIQGEHSAKLAPLLSLHAQAMCWRTARR